MAEKKVDKTDFKLGSKLKHEPDQGPSCEKDFDMLTWNVSGSKSEKHFSEIRKSLIPTVKKALKREPVTFFQELTSGVTIAQRDWGFRNVVAPIGGGKKEAAISTPEKDATFTLGDFIGEEKLKCIIGKKRLEELKIIEDSGPRVYGQELRLSHRIGHSKYVCDIIVLSYHAPYKTDNKVSKMVCFFEEMCKVADEEKKTLIIGGDFNLKVLEWKDEVEGHSNLHGRVSVALYVASPNRWNECIDTFAIVHPKNVSDRTECRFKKTTAIYPFPMVGHVGGDTSMLLDYPNSKYPWFKFIHYSDKDKTEVETELKKKGEKDQGKMAAQQDQMDTLTKSFEKLAIGHWQAMPPPAPLWPKSPLHQVLDHDPVLTTITFTLRKESGDETSTGNVNNQTSLKRTAAS